MNEQGSTQISIRCRVCDHLLGEVTGSGTCKKCGSSFDTNKPDTVNASGRPLGFLLRAILSGPGSILWCAVACVFAIMVWVTVVPASKGIIWFLLWLLLVVLLMSRFMIARAANRNLRWQGHFMSAMNRRYRRMAYALIAVFMAPQFDIPLRVGFALSRNSLQNEAASFKGSPGLVDMTPREIGWYSIKEIHVSGQTVYFHTSTRTSKGEWVWFVNDPSREIENANWFSVYRNLGNDWYIGDGRKEGKEYEHLDNEKRTGVNHKQ